MGVKDEHDTFNFQATWNMVKRLADQISHPSIAVAELIKNSYDADATEVLVNMKNSMDEKVENCRIVIHDDGHGMTINDLKTKWSNVGISDNKSNPFSPRGRSRQGGLGLGRFGGWKLGMKVTLATRAKNNPVYALTIDFSEHTPDTPLEEVMTPILTDPKAFKNLFPDGKTGTWLMVEKFNESMSSHNDIQKIQRATQTLLNPFEGDDDFKIILQLPQKFKKWEDFGIKEVIDQALYKYEVEIDARGQTIQGVYVDNNPYSKHYQEESIISDKTSDLLDGEKCQIKAVKVWIYHFHRGANYKKLWPKTSYGTLSKEQYNQRLSGFRLYKDSVRVFPYGETGNDWLLLDYMQNKQRAVDWFSNTQIVAAARFDMTANMGAINDKSNREGLEDSIGKRQLFKILQLQVKKMRALVNRDYPDKIPARLEEVNFEYGKFNIEVGQDINIFTRSLGGDVTTQYIITKGKKPDWLIFDSITGNFSGTAMDVGKIKLVIKAGNSQGNNTADIFIDIVPRQTVIDNFGTEIIDPKEDSFEEEIISGGEVTGIGGISSLDTAISDIKIDIINLQEETNSDRKKKLLIELKTKIQQILQDEGIDI